MNVAQINIKVSELINGKYILDRRARSLGSNTVIKLDHRHRKSFSVTRDVQINDQQQQLQQAWYFGAVYEARALRKKENQQTNASTIKINAAREAELTIEWQVFPTSA